MFSALFKSPKTTIAGFIAAVALGVSHGLSYEAAISAAFIAMIGAGYHG